MTNPLDGTVNIFENLKFVTLAVFCYTCHIHVLLVQVHEKTGLVLYITLRLINPTNSGFKSKHEKKLHRGTGLYVAFRSYKKSCP